MTVSIGPKAIRKMALYLLDDENGISERAYVYLSGMLVESGNEDILQQVDATNGRFYIGEDYAEEELEKLDSESDICVWTLKGQGYETECGLTDMMHKEGFCECGKRIEINEQGTDS